ncbi:MAG: hypothetical protein ACJA1A_001693 [Saprospiraceae bacterium]|jgi:hypothetical protein
MILIIIIQAGSTQFGDLILLIRDSTVKWKIFKSIRARSRREGIPDVDISAHTANRHSY